MAVAAEANDLAKYWLYLYFPCFVSSDTYDTYLVVLVLYLRDLSSLTKTCQQQLIAPYEDV